MTEMQKLYLLVPLAPLFGAVVAGLFGKIVGRRGAHIVTILGVAAAFVGSVFVFKDVQAGNTFNGTLYTWATSGGITFEVGFLIVDGPPVHDWLHVRGPWLPAILQLHLAVHVLDVDAGDVQ